MRDEIEFAIIAEIERIEGEWDRRLTPSELSGLLVSLVEWHCGGFKDSEEIVRRTQAAGLERLIQSSHEVAA